MGWKLSCIIIPSKEKVNALELLTELGFNNLKYQGEDTFDTVMNPYGKNEVHIGRFNDNIIITEGDLPFAFLEVSLSEAELKLNKLFPDTEISTFVLQSVVNMWGYSISKNMLKLRLRLGMADTGTTLDIGEVLEEEKSILAASEIDEKGNRVYYYPEFPNESFQEDQVGEDFVFEVAKRYLGERIDASDTLLFKTKFKTYSFS